MKKIFLALPFLAVGIIGCEKQNLTEVEEAEAPVEQSRAGEFENPYEWVGVEHNNVLQYLIDIDSYEYSDAVDYVSDALDVDPEVFLEYSEVESDIDMILDPEADYLGTLGLSVNVMGALDEVEDILFTSEDRSADFDAFADATYHSALYSANDRNMLLGSIAVAKNSNIFWSDYYEGASGIDILKPFKVAWADTRGFICGFRKSTFHGAFSNGVSSGGVASRIAGR